MTTPLLGPLLLELLPLYFYVIEHLTKDHSFFFFLNTLLDFQGGLKLKGVFYCTIKIG